VETFGDTLKKLREAAGLSQNALAKAAGLNASYVNRLESGEREPPRPETVMQLAHGLGDRPEITDELLAAAGHLPLAMSKLGPRDPALGLVAEILTDEKLTKEDREEFRQVLISIGKRWRRPSGK
jgi:transcriptional regulator with XRE-family HTH domain